MLNKKKFRIKMIEQEKTMQDIANYLEISPVTLWRKMKGESDFYCGEVQKLTTFLNIDNPMEIFFAQNIS